MREEGAKHAAETRPDTVNPWDEPDESQRRLASLADAYPTVEHDDDQTARYNDWAQRMHEKRRRVVQERTGVAEPSYWTTDALFEESRRVEDEEQVARPNPWRVPELLAVLDLREGATRTDIGEAYRRLAKLHHPDHFMDADPTIQEYHATRFREILKAYRALKQLQQA